MQSRRQDVSEDRQVTSRRYKEPSNISVNGKVNSESIPVDLVIEILSRLPAKFILRCRCVSKLWASILRSPDFTELFLTRSHSCPQLLFTCNKPEKGELFFFSSPHPRYSDGNSSLATTASYRMKVPFKNQYQRIWLINGLVFLRDERIVEGRKIRATVICNPSTGQSLVLSKVKTRDWQFSYFGYDPVEKQFKVLSITGTCVGTYTVSSQEFQVLTLGTKNMSWRKIECCTPHFPTFNVVCINGVLYYEADVSGVTMIVCFDIRYEKFSFIIVSKSIIGFRRATSLINYNGKLATLASDEFCFKLSFEPFFSGVSSCFVMWILEDTEKHEWSKRIFNVDFGVYRELDFVGMVGGNEIVFSPDTHSLPFYVFYYNIEQNTVRRVEIQGLEGSKGKRVQTFLNFVEEIKPIDGYYSRAMGGFLNWVIIYIHL